MTARLRIAIGQINCCVGDIHGNLQKIIETSREAQVTLQADLIVFPELTLTGYPPEDLLLRQGLIRQVDEAMQTLQAAALAIDIVVGHPWIEDGRLYNAATVIRQGKVICRYFKQELPNYAVFDEKRYFSPGDRAGVFECNGIRIGLSVCEDIWFEHTVAATRQAGAQLVLSMNASPYHYDKLSEREDVVRQRAQAASLPVVYVNMVGGQDELVFDGASFVMDATGEVCARQCSFAEQTRVIDLLSDADGVRPLPAEVLPHPPLLESVLQALICGVRDYVTKSGFDGVVLGLSGGIDSALTLYVAVEALGAKNVETVMLPTRYTADISLEDAARLAQTLQVEYRTIAIESVFNAFVDLLAEEFAGLAPDVTEENMQARCRGLILMAISNKKHKMVLTTGNKSEMAVGYSTLYGDMAGGFDVLKDVPKTLVYRLSEYINRNDEVIPERIITRPPSAELSENQTDQDSLPPYEILDAILEAYVEHDRSIADMVAAGYAIEDVQRVVSLIDNNEYKRRQAPPGVRITRRAFGKDRRYPIVSRFRDV